MIAPEFIIFACMISGSFIFFTVIAINIVAYFQGKGWIGKK